MHVLPPRQLRDTTTSTPHPTPSQVITLLALFIMQPHPFMHRRGNPCQTAKQHSNKTAFSCSPQFQPLWPRRNGRRGGQRTSKVKREGSCGVTGMVMTTRVHRDATPRSSRTFAAAIPRHHLPSRCALSSDEYINVSMCFSRQSTRCRLNVWIHAQYHGKCRGKL